MSAFSTSRKFGGAVALVAAAALALSGCAAAGPEIKGDGVLKLGAVIPLTGSLSFLSPPEIAGIELAVQDINAAGGVLGKPVEFSIEDSSDGDHPEIAPASATKVLSECSSIRRYPLDHRPDHWCKGRSDLDVKHCSRPFNLG
jgi:branched-chain amino acid transport system substrate-binding protein